MLAIRLQRVGKKKFATYRIIVSEKARDTWGDYLEQLGTFNPHAKEAQLLPDTERILFWIGKGAQPSPTLHNLFVNAGIITEKKKKSVFISKKRAVKIAAKKASAAEKAA